jgi:ribosomal protein S18 acetylase RimI-like enzyme
MIISAPTSARADATAVLVLAFSTDPLARWCWPDPGVYLEYFPPVVTAFGGRAFAAGSAYMVQGGAGAALWLPPGIEPDEAAMDALFQRSVPAHRRGELATVMEKMAEHHPKEPHWYLPLIGVDPSRQRGGHGSALMRHALAACDRAGRIAYLESANPRNVPFYQRLGFERLGTIQPGSAPPVFPMLRKPRA